MPPDTPRPRLQASLSHVLNLQDEVVARPGFPAVDLFKGGAIGFGGGGTRHSIDASANLSDREVGVRVNATWRGASRLNIGSEEGADQLRFSPLTIVNVRTFADLSQLWTGRAFLKDLRVSLGVLNLFNQRQRVLDAAGVTPLRYQPGYRDAIGRTVELEIRKTL
jgi:hypothetical protein